MPSERQFRPGCIVSLRMENFMHYHDQTIQPTSGFNVVIGHNGSGKSAIVNAICIGLGESTVQLFLTEDEIRYVTLLFLRDTAKGKKCPLWGLWVP